VGSGPFSSTLSSTNTPGEQIPSENCSPTHGLKGLTDLQKQRPVSHLTCCTQVGSFKPGYVVSLLGMQLNNQLQTKKHPELGGETLSRIRAWSLICNEKIQLFSLRYTAMGLRSQRLLHVQGDAGHPG
jgi:hypothetical protein